MRQVGFIVSLLTVCHLGQAEPLHSNTASDSAGPHTEPSQRELARECFALGVSLAQAGRYAAAKALFLEAYAAEPHYVVLYNLAQADVQLGDFASAARSLRQYLDAAGTAISPEWRQEVENEIERIDALRATPPEVDPTALTPRASGGVLVEDSDGNASDATSDAGAAPLESPSTTTRGMLAEPHPDGAPNDKTRRLGSYLLTIGGFAVLGGAVGLYVWNHERFNQWQNERDELLATGPSVTPENELIINEQVRASNSRLTSIQSFDVVPLITGGVGVAALGAGLWMLLRTPGTEHVQVSSGLSELDVRVRWMW